MSQLKLITPPWRYLKQTPPILPLSFHDMSSQWMDSITIQQTVLTHLLPALPQHTQMLCMQSYRFAISILLIVLNYISVFFTWSSTCSLHLLHHILPLYRPIRYMAIYFLHILAMLSYKKHGNTMLKPKTTIKVG